MNFKNLLSLVFLLCISISLEAQAIKVQACARTTDVSPVMDNQGNDRRHLSAFYLDYITIEEFGTATPKTYASFGTNGKNWDNGIWVDGCQSNQATNSCGGCSTCLTPTVDGGEAAGQIIGDIENNARVKSVNNQLLIEATNEKDICYETPWVDISESLNKFVYLSVGYNGTTTDGNTRTMNIKLNYKLLSDGIERNFMNKWSNFETPSEQNVRTIQVTSTKDLGEYVNLSLTPNPAESVLNMEINSDRNMELEVVVMGLTGSNILSENTQLIDGENNLQINIDSLPAGNYFVTLIGEGRQMTEQFVKK